MSGAGRTGTRGRRGGAGGPLERAAGEFDHPERRLAELMTPHRDERMERVVLACVILRCEDAWSFVEGTVTADDFYDPRHRAIFEAVEVLVAQGRPVDMHTLTHALGARLDAVGGAQYLNELCGDVTSAAFIEDYAKALAETGVVRRIQDVAIKTLLSVGRPLPEVLAAAAEMQQAAEGRGRVGTGSTSDQLMVKVFSRLENGAQTGGRVGRSYGVAALDDITGGATDGQLIIEAARPAMGKTSLDVGHLTAMARESKARGEEGIHLFFSLEMPDVEIGQRMLCQVSRVDESKVRQACLSQDEITATTAAANEIAGLPFKVIDDATTLQQIRSACHRARLKYGRVLSVHVDYLQLMEDESVRGNKNLNRENEIQRISKGLKRLAKELPCPVIALAQLNRKCEERGNKRPMLSDLREGGSIEQDADVVMFIYRDEVYDKNTEDRGIAELIIAKQRSGPVDTARVRFIRACTLFENLTAKDDGGGEAPYAAGGYGKRGRRGAGGSQSGEANDDVPFGPDDALPPYQE